MKFLCQIPGCKKNGKVSCQCDSKVIFCPLHFIEIHQKLPGNHDCIHVSEQSKLIYSKIQEAFKKLRETKFSIVLKTSLMIEKIGCISKAIISKITLEEAQLTKIFVSSNHLENSFNLIEKAMKFEVIDESLDNFEQIIKKYLEIRPTLGNEDNQKVKEKTNQTILSESQVISRSSHLSEDQKLHLGVHGFIKFDYAIYSAAITNDSKYIIFGIGDNTMRVLDFKSKRQEAILQGHRGIVWCTAITSDKKYVVSGSEDKTVRIWNLNAKTQVSVLEGHAGWVGSVAITSDNKYIVSGGEDATVRIWDFNKKTQVSVLEGHAGWVGSVAITSDNKYIVSGSEDATVRIWDFNKKTQEAILIGHVGWVGGLAITSDNKYVVSGSLDTTLRVWSLTNNTQKAVLKGHTEFIRSVVITSDNKYAVSSGWDKTIRVWNLHNYTQEAVLGSHTGLVWSIVITTDDKYIVSVSEDKNAIIWTL